LRIITAKDHFQHQHVFAVARHNYEAVFCSPRYEDSIFKNDSNGMVVIPLGLSGQSWIDGHFIVFSFGNKLVTNLEGCTLYQE